MVFIDTNVWVYALSGQDHAKREIAIELIARTYRDDMICVSSQVLKEFANFALNTLSGRGAFIGVAFRLGAFREFFRRGSEIWPCAGRAHRGRRLRGLRHRPLGSQHLY